VIRDRLLGMQREAVFEVQIEDEHEGEREHEHSHGEGGALVRAPVPHAAKDPDKREEHREHALQAIRPVVCELPTEVLRVVDELRPIQRRRMPDVAVAGRLRGIVEHRRLPVLHAEDDVPQRFPGRRLTFVDRRIEMGANRQIRVDRHADDHYEQRRDRKRDVAGHDREQQRAGK